MADDAKIKRAKECGILKGAMREQGMKVDDLTFISMETHVYARREKKVVGLLAGDVMIIDQTEG